MGKWFTLSFMDVHNPVSGKGTVLDEQVVTSFKHFDQDKKYNNPFAVSNYDRK